VELAIQAYAFGISYCGPDTIGVFFPEKDDPIVTLSEYLEFRVYHKAGGDLVDGPDATWDIVDWEIAPTGGNK
jgi:hypothetical protein